MEISGILEKDSVAQVLIDAFPSAVFLMDKDLRVKGVNRQGARFIGDSPELALKRLCGEAIHCFHNQESLKGCGTTPFCKECVIREGVKTALEGKGIFRKKYEMILEKQGAADRISLLITSSPFKQGNHSLALIILEDITELTELSRLLPICSSCKKIRDDKNYWETFENYLKKYSNIDFTHSLCPDCAKKLYDYKAVK